MRMTVRTIMTMGVSRSMHLPLGELKRSVVWALAIGTLVLIFGIAFARTAAHSSGFFLALYRVLLAPSMSVSFIESEILGAQLPPSVALITGLILHYLAYFLVTLGIRRAYKRSQPRGS